MDILGFFDGLFSAFSAMRSGKRLDEEKVSENSPSKPSDHETAQKIARLHEAQHELAEMRAKTRNQSRTKEHDHDRDMR